MSRIETIAQGVTLYLGDCRDVLPSLGQADAVLTDPPYEKHMHEASRRSTDARAFGTDGYANPPPLISAAWTTSARSVTPLLVAATQKWLLAFCTPEGVAPWRDAIEAAGARYKRACVLYKPDSAPQFNGQGPAMAAEMFVTAWCGEGHSRWNGGGRRNVFIYPTNNADREGTHPTEKPLALMMELVTLFSDVGGMVFDPFMGSGTTGRACVRLGRRFIGIEKIPRYFDIACRQIEAATKQPDMFIAAPRAATQVTFAEIWKAPYYNEDGTVSALVPRK
jgi:site-specific DNA-methyltransferase (adenine-specific)